MNYDPINNGERMLGQDPDMPFATRPELDWEQFSKSHDFPKSLHERFLYHPPYRGAWTGGSTEGVKIVREFADNGDAIALPLIGAEARGCKL
jgi:hypothetical protein